MFRVLALTVALLLVGNVVGLAVTGRDDEPPPPTTAASTAAPSAPTTPPQQQPAADSPIQAVVPELQRFVERSRGLAFKQPVKVELLEGEAFVNRLKGAGERDVESLQKAEGFLRALHLIDSDVKLEGALDTLLASAVAGFYDPKTKALVVRGGEASPYVRSVLVHELTHALQDQHFDLDRPELDKRSDEASQAFTGLVEGDAVRIQIQYVLSLSPADRRSFLRDEEANADDSPQGVPDVLVDVLVFPYEAGPAFVADVLKAGGQPRLDAAFATAPQTSEELLHPAVFLRREGAKPAPTPKAEGKVTDQGVFGEFGLRLLLDDELGTAEARKAAGGWGGDTYVAWRQGGTTCVRTTFVMDTPKDSAELGAALRTWAKRHPGATVEGTDPLTFTSCG